METKHLVWVLCAGLAFGAACQRSQSANRAAGSSGREATRGEVACAHELGVPPEVGEGDEPTVQRACTPARSVNGEVAKRPEEL